MINVSTITKQIKEWFEADVDFSGFIITRSEYVNEDPGLAKNGWMGIYRRRVAYEPRNLGVAPNNYEGEVTIDFVIQKTNLLSGENAEDDLEYYVKRFLDKLVQLPKTYLDHFSVIDVEYTYLESEKRTLYFQGALITATAEFSTSVN